MNLIHYNYHNYIAKLDQNSDSSRAELALFSVNPQPNSNLPPKPPPGKVSCSANLNPILTQLNIELKWGLEQLTNTALYQYCQT
jgi:hypothetical protein